MLMNPIFENETSKALFLFAPEKEPIDTTLHLHLCICRTLSSYARYKWWVYTTAGSLKTKIPLSLFNTRREYYTFKALLCEGTLFSPCDETLSLGSSSCVFQELSKITMPVIFNEPLSFLQRLTEYMEHTYLIHQANASSDPIERMKVVHPATTLDTSYAKDLSCVKYKHILIIFYLWLWVQCIWLCSSAVGSVWLRLRCPLWPPSGSGQVNPSTPCWEKLMNWSGKLDYTAHVQHWLYTKIH